jgi:general secretion pathway protein K
MSSIRDSGQMLVIVLWVMGLVSLAIGALVVRSSHELRLGRFPIEVLQRRAIAQAALEQAIRVIQQDTQESQIDTLEEPWASGHLSDETPLFEQIAVGQGMFSVGRIEQDIFMPGLIDEERKLNLNTALPAYLQNLIQLVGPEGSDAEAISAAIIDWRQHDEPEEGPFCEEANPPCHNGPFDSVDELRLVPGMTPELFDALEPLVTVYGASGTVNINTTEPNVLSAMGYDPEAIIQQRPYTTSPYPNMGVSSSVFTVPVKARIDNSSLVMNIVAVIDRIGCQLDPPEHSRCILAWSVD